MNSAHSCIRTWLEEVLGDSPPPYELSEEACKALKALREASKERERRMELMEALKRKQAEEYKAEAERMERGMESVGVAPKQLPGPAESMVEVMAEVAAILDVDHPDGMSLSLRLGQVLEKTAGIPEEDAKTATEEREMQQVRLLTLERVTAVCDRLRAEEKELSRKNERTAQAHKKTEFMREKQRDYTRSAAAREAELTRAGMRSELRQERLLSVAEEIKRKEEEELAPLKAKLEGFRSLPPDLGLAKIKLAELEAELAELTQRLTALVNMMHI